MKSPISISYCSLSNLVMDQFTTGRMFADTMNRQIRHLRVRYFLILRGVEFHRDFAISLEIRPTNLVKRKIFGWRRESKAFLIPPDVLSFADNGARVVLDRVIKYPAAALSRRNIFLLEKMDERLMHQIKYCSYRMCFKPQWRNPEIARISQVNAGTAGTQG